MTLGYNEELFLDITARNDWSSTLPINSNSFFYPGATLSWLFSNRLNNNDVLTFGKIRAAYGMTGSDAGVYQTSVKYTQASLNGYYYGGIAEFPMHSVNAFIANSSKGSASLRPELTREAELGLNLQFFNGRIGFDGAFYNRITSDQIFSLPVDPATGYRYMITNFGDVRNRGYELLFNFIPVQGRDFSWEIDVNFSRNYNKVLSLPEGLDEGKSVINSFSAGNDAVYVYAEEGKYDGGVSGTNFSTAAAPYNSTGHWCRPVASFDMPVSFLSLAEVKFFLAEYAAKYGIGDAAAYYAEAIEASFASAGVAGAAEYIALNPYKASNYKESIGVAKWIALAGVNPFEAYCELRRLKYPAFETSISGSDLYVDGGAADTSKLPAYKLYTPIKVFGQVGPNALLQRFPYAESSDTPNANCPEFPGYSAPIFWAK